MATSVTSNRTVDERKRMTVTPMEKRTSSGRAALYVPGETCSLDEPVDDKFRTLATAQ